jgi:ribose 1,5-bisphosphokinase
MSGKFIAIVGPSGVGKDSLIDFARERLASSDRVVFVRRVVTRPADGGSEDHESMDEADFLAAEAAGAFALSWTAHGLHYGLPIALEDDLAAGRLVVANLSRRVIPALLARHPDAVVVSVTATRDVLARRLAARGRETPASIRARLDREIDNGLPRDAVRIDNSGDLAESGEQFTRLLKTCAGLALP